MFILYQNKPLNELNKILPCVILGNMKGRKIENPSKPVASLGFRKQRLGGKRKTIRVIGALGKRYFSDGKPIDINIEMVHQLAKQMLPLPDIAGILGIRTDELSSLINSNGKLGDAIELGYSETRQSLRKTQLDLALNGHPSMLMWLGKQYLGQSDKHNVETKTEISVTVSRAMDELRNIPKDKLLEAMKIMESPTIENPASDD